MDKVDLKTMYLLPWSLYLKLDLSLIITMTCDDANLFHKYVYQYKIKSFNENEGLSIRRFKRACTVMTKKVNSHLIGSPMNGLEFDKHSRSCRVMISEVGLYF